LPNTFELDKMWYLYIFSLEHISVLKWYCINNVLSSLITVNLQYVLYLCFVWYVCELLVFDVILWYSASFTWPLIFKLSHVLQNVASD
jgi:hypothetical protein